MPQLWSTGPVSLYIGPINALPIQAVVVGTGREAPHLDVRPAFDPVMNDLGGSRISFDTMYEGADATISIDLNRYNYDRVEQLLQHAQTSTALLGNLITLGNDPPGAVGALMLTEQLAHTLFVLFPFAVKPAFSGGPSGAMRIGYRFPACTLETSTWDQLGTRAQQIRLVWHAHRVPYFVRTKSPSLSTAAPTLPQAAAPVNLANLNLQNAQAAQAALAQINAARAAAEQAPVALNNAGRVSSFLLYDNNVVGLPAMY